MPDGGIVVTVRNEEVLPVYLAYGVYGDKLRLGTHAGPNPEHYVRALADYAGRRQGDHLFFRCRGRFYYGGRIRGSSEHGAFYLNGRCGLLGSRADPPTVWDESEWERYEPPSRAGLDSVSRPSVCQPFLLRFRDWLGLQGRWIEGCRLFYALRDCNYLLPTTHAASNVFPVSPGEADRLLALLMEDADGELCPPEDANVEFTKEPTPYDPAYGPNPIGARSRDGLVAAVVANAEELPPQLQRAGAAIAHRVPISPYRPRNVELADVGYYTDRNVRDGTLPDVLLYLEPESAGERLRQRIDRQYAWLESLLGREIHEIKLYAAAPEFTAGFYESDRERTAAALDEVELRITRSGL